MTVDEMLNWLNDELRNFPDRRSGEDLYRYLVAQTQDVSSTAREELIGALEEWLRGESEPQTMLALDLAVDHGLTEMRVEIEALLHRVVGDTAFRPALRPYYRKRIEEALRRLCSSTASS